MNYKLAGGLISLAVLTLLLSGCSLDLFNSTPPGEETTGGIFRTDTAGSAWVQKALIPTSSGRPGTIAAVEGASLAIDPSDNKAVYFGTIGNGLLYSYDGGENWQPAKGLGAITVTAITVDASNKCVIYAASGNRLYKSIDCSRTWNQIYFDTNTSIRINDVTVDAKNGKIIYFVNSRGDLVRSDDAGVSWHNLKNFGNLAVNVVVSPFDSNIIMVATQKKYLWRSNDAGKTWLSLGDNLKNIKNAGDYRFLVASTKQAGLWFMATNYGIAKSVNNGDDWTALTLLTPEKEDIKINGLAISGQDVKNLYYLTGTTFYHSTNGGDTWSSAKLPTPRSAWLLAVDPKNDQTLYLATRINKQ